MSNLQEVPTEDLLAFHDFPGIHQQNSINTGGGSNDLNQIKIDVGLDDDFQNTPELNDPLENEPSNSSKNLSLWSLEFYQRFFDVDTEDVTDRIINSMIPKGGNPLFAQITQKPDLYGPFWISMTLIFTIAISGNIANYLQHGNNEWRYDFKLVSYAATATWIYVLVIPSIIWTLLSFNTNEEISKPPSIFELVCIYGYSLFIYIPIAIMWSIQISNLQWFLAICSSLISGSVLLLNLMPTIKHSKHKIFLTTSIILCNLLFAAGFMLYFFHAPNNNNNAIIEGVLTHNVTETAKL